MSDMMEALHDAGSAARDTLRRHGIEASSVVVHALIPGGEDDPFDYTAASHVSECRSAPLAAALRKTADQIDPEAADA